jgi:diadenosine tetraphosphate (Ap4A) HIT family hydrolase
VILNREQSILGKSMVVLRRHTELLSELEPDEWPSLQMVAVQTTNAIRNAFAADHFNYAFLQTWTAISTCMSYRAMGRSGSSRA